MARPDKSPIDSASPLLAALLDQSHECIKLLDHEGRILFVNRQGAAAMELSSPHELHGLSWIDRWPEAARAEVSNAFRAARNGTAARFTASRPDPHGGQRWWDVTVTPTGDERDGTAHILTIARDITAEVTERERVVAITAEMRHRLKNAMTIAAGIVTMSARSRPEAQPFATEVCERFAQLAALQDLLLDPAREKRLPDIVPLLANAYGGGSLLRFGAYPEVCLGHAAMQALALAFGELATNSLKYGALKRGRPIEIGATASDRLLHLAWREPTDFGDPREGGQGLGLIDRLVAASGGSFEREVRDGLLNARISVPTL